jgi:hypothetical protein
MPRYFFHITHDESSMDDKVGVELPNRTAAWDGAASACEEFIGEFDGQPTTETVLQVEVHDQEGPLFRITTRMEVLR